MMDTQPQTLVFYTAAADECPFEAWLNRLRDRQARVRIRSRLDRVGMGNFGDYKAVGEGVFELRVDYGPGYRIYFAKAGSTIVLLLCGGAKSTQPQDILKAQDYWKTFQNQDNAN
jgi:putative addiction module killer protein